MQHGQPQLGSLNTPLLVGVLFAMVGGACNAQTEWKAIRPGGETICSSGTEYVFYVREKNPDHVLVHFQGGGACWNPDNCNQKVQPTYDPVTDDQDHPGDRGGILDLTNPENPFADATVVYVTYCTADVHLGDAVVTYARTNESGKATELKIHHKGMTNGTAALAWLFDRVETPKSVFVSGSSAGALAAPFYAGVLADHYPEARIAVLADGGGGYHAPPIPGILEDWGTTDAVRTRPQYREVDAASLDFETYVEVEAQRFPRATFAQVNSHGDSVQLFFLTMLGVTNTPLIDLIDKNHAELRSAAPNFRTFTERGSSHTILSRPRLYTLEVQGTKLIDWIRAMAEGRPVEDVRYDDEKFGE